MRIIGLTGSIACGKSNVSDTLAELGACIIDGDKLSRELTVPGGPALPAIHDAFGDTVFTANGELNRRALGMIVFADTEAMQKLDALMQPLIRRLILQRMDAARESGAQVCVLDMPLLYEKQLEQLCDSVWCVWIPKELQLQRLMERDGLTEEQAMQRITSQLSADEKAARADVVIDTSGSIDYTKAMIPPLLQKEMQQAGYGA